MEQQIQEIDKLNIVINNLEKEMLLLKVTSPCVCHSVVCVTRVRVCLSVCVCQTRYEHSVEQRNLTGVQLIDRNDELCILYERSNQQQETIKKGEMVRPFPTLKVSPP